MEGYSYTYHCLQTYTSLGKMNSMMNKSEYYIDIHFECFEKKNLLIKT